MRSRLDLHEVLCGILGSRNVYFQPPESIKMKYPAIVYHLSNIPVRYADNGSYEMHKTYNLTLIDKNPDSTTVEELLKLPYCSFDRAYSSDNINHFAFTLHY